MKNFSKVFLKGLFAILPLMLTVGVVLWMGRGLEAFFGTFVRIFLPDSWYIPGMGIFVSLGFIYLLGLMLQSFTVQRLQRWVESLIGKFPFVGKIYRSIEGMTHYFSESDSHGLDQVVMVGVGSVGSPGMQVMGLVTRDDLNSAPEGIKNTDKIMVYLPWSYQIGGITLYVSREDVTPVSMSKKEALRWTMTAGMDAGANTLSD